MLAAVAALMAWPCSTDPSIRPRIFIYPETVGIPPFRIVDDARLRVLSERIKTSPHYTTHGECADFFVLHQYAYFHAGAPYSHTGGVPLMSSARVLELLDRVAKEYPFWNRTHADGPVRHLMIMPCDHGAAD